MWAVDIIRWLRPRGPRLNVGSLTNVLTRMLQGKSFYQKVVSGPVQNIFAFTKWHCIFKTLFENSEVYVIIRSIVAEIRNIFSVILDSVECFSHSIYLHIGTVALLCFATYIALCHFLIFYVEKRWQLMEPSKVISFPVHCGLMVGKNHVFNYCHRRYEGKVHLVLGSCGFLGLAKICMNEIRST